MKGKLAFVAGAGLGYLLGTRAGRGQFEKIKGWANDVWQDPRVQGYVQDVEGQATAFAKQQGAALKDTVVDAAKQAVAGGAPWKSSGSTPESDDPTPTVVPCGPVIDVGDARTRP